MLKMCDLNVLFINILTDSFLFLTNIFKMREVNPVLQKETNFENII